MKLGSKQADHQTVLVPSSHMIVFELAALLFTQAAKHGTEIQKYGNTGEFAGVVAVHCSKQAKCVPSAKG